MTLNRVISYLKHTALSLGFSVVCSPVWAGCSGPYQFPISELDNKIFRTVLETTQDELERFFDFGFAAVCMDDEEYGAYYELESQNMVLGTQFFLDAANPPGNLNKAIAMIAHEAAHAFQSKHGLLDLLVETNPHRVKCIELHADFLAGGVMGWRSRTYDINEKDLSKVFFMLGDNMTGTDGHHGRGAERFLSFRQGFNTQTDDEITLSSMGIAYVSQANCDE